MKKFYPNCIAIFFCLTFSLIILPSCKNNNGAALEQKEDEKDEYDSPEIAAQFETFRTLDVATGKVPYRRFWDAIMETDALKNATPSSTSSSNALTPLAWVERGSNSDAVGPSNGNSRSGNEVTSGRMRSVWVDLADATGKTVWVGGVSGGLWKTNDITTVPATWTLVNDYLSNLAIASICQDPTNTNIMYFSTGESYRTGGGVGGIGVFKSIDHGVTWNLLTSPAVTILANSTKILCDNLGNVYVNSQGISIAAGLQRSSDGGNTWVSINPFTTAPSATSRIIDFEISSTGVMHIVGGFFDSAPGIGGYRYTANPATATSTSGWNTPTTLYPVPNTSGARVEITTAGNTIYAAISNADKIDMIGKSIDGGNNWTTTNLTALNITDLNGGGQGTYSNTIGVDPSNPNNVIVGSLNLLKSIDGGLTFSKLTTWVGLTLQYVHADQHNITWYDNGNKMLVGSDGGLFYSTNKGTNFLDKNVGLRLKQFYGVSIHPTSTNYFLAGAQDNGTHQFNGPGLTSSIEVLGGDGGFTGIDQDEPQFQSGAYVYANFRRSSNSGANWVSSGSANTSGLFINPYDYDNVGNKVYAGYAAGQFLRWEDPHSAFTFTPVTVSEFGTGTVTSTTVSPTVANRVYFGVFSSKIFRLDNADLATPLVTDITPSGIQASTYISCVTEGLASNQNLLATQSRTTTGFTHVWSSNNGGTSWVACDGNLPNIPVYWAVYHPDADTKAYIATETGVWSTDLLNGTSTVWTPESTFPTVKTSMLKYRASDRTIAAATYGRGLWTAIIPNSTCAPAAITSQPTATTVCAGATATFTVTATGFAPLTYQWQVSTTGAGGTFTNVGTNSATLTLTGVTAAMNNNFYHVVVTNTCPSTVTSSNVLLTVQNTLAPTVTSPVSYCQNAAAVALTANGTNLLWYGTNATGGTGSPTAPTPSTTTLGNTTYYVSQTGPCGEGPRASIMVNVTAAPSAPNVTPTVAYCQGASATALTASGTNLLWYTAATTGTGSTTAPIPPTTTAGSTIYYVSQTTSGCESPRSSITVNVTASPSAPTVITPATYCQNATANALAASGTNLLWYGTNATGGTGSTTAPVPNTTTVGNTIYYVSQSNGTCESPRAGITVSIVASTPAPSVTSPLSYCQGSTASALTATGTNLLWYGINATGGTGSSTGPTPSTTTAGSTTYYVSQTTSCGEGPRAGIVVNVVATASAPTATSPIAYCQGATAAALTAVGSNLLWYTNSTGGTGSVTAPIPSTAVVGSTVYYVTQTVGCESQRTAIVVNINVTPSAPIANSPINYCQGGTATALIATGNNLQWYTVATGGTASSTAPIPSTTTAGTTIYYVSQTTGACESSRTGVSVIVSAGPAITAQPQSITSCSTSATFNVTASGSNLTYQWQLSVDGGLTYTNIFAATSSSYTASGLTAAQANNKYRVVVSSASCSSVTSSAVTAQVGVAPSVTLTAAPAINFNPFTNGGLYTSITPAGNYTYQWKRNNVILPLVTISSMTKANGLLDAFGTYQVTVVDVTSGCVGTSNIVTVADFAGQRNRLFISPNPTQGIVRLSYYSSTSAAQGSIVTLYDSKGSKVMTKAFIVAGNYGSAELNLTSMNKGTYLVVLKDAAGNKIATERILKY